MLQPRQTIARLFGWLWFVELINLRLKTAVQVADIFSFVNDLLGV